MATVRIKYRPSIRTGKEGTVYYRITHKQTIRQITTPYRIFREEWDAQKSEVALACGGRELFLRTVREHTARDAERLRTIIGRLETAGCAFTATTSWTVSSHLRTKAPSSVLWRNSSPGCNTWVKSAPRRPMRQPRRVSCGSEAAATSF